MLTITRKENVLDLKITLKDANCRNKLKNFIEMFEKYSKYFFYILKQPKLSKAPTF